MDKDTKDISLQIKNIFEKNKLENLNSFIKKRHMLNCSNMFLSYSFNILQSAGIFITTISTGCKLDNLVWVGIGLNILASLFRAFEDTNNAISKKLLDDIIDIKNEYMTEVIIESIAIKKANNDYLVENLISPMPKSSGNLGSINDTIETPLI